MLPHDVLLAAVLQIAVPDAVAFSQPAQVVSDAAHPVRPAAARTATPATISSPWGPVHANTWFGRGYDPRFELTRECIAVRESDNTRTSINSGGYSGYYQFGLSWTRTIQNWTGEHVPIVQMSTQAQDEAFWIAFDHGRGASNWAGGRWSCPGVRY